MMSRSPHAVLFDIDGTLVDSNYLHVEAWARAFGELGVAVDTWRLHRMIGLDSDLLLENVLGDRVADLGEEARRLNSELYLTMTDRLRPFDGARELIRDLVE